MTNFERIKSMTKEEMIEFLVENVDIDNLCEGYCRNVCPCKNEDAKCAEYNCLTEAHDKMEILWWLNKEATV